MIKRNETRYLLVVVGFALLAVAVMLNPSLLEFSGEDMNIRGYAGEQAAPLSGVTGTGTIDRDQEVILGDVDRDGMIDRDDLSTMQRIPFGKQNPARSDLDKDGNVDEADVALLRDYVGGRILALPVRKGDVNDDLQVTLRDIELIAAYTDGLMTFSPDQFYAADLDADGNVDKDDVALAVGMLPPS